MTLRLSEATLGFTSVKLTWKVVLECEPSALVAVTVTLYGCSSSPVPDQFQVPSPLSTTPGPATLTASSEAIHVPLVAGVQSCAPPIAALAAVTVGFTSVKLTWKVVLECEP